MKKSELKNIIKPLVKECITEALIEEGLLSNVISEVMKGMSPVITEAVPAPERTPVMQEARQERTEQMKENRKKLLDAIGKDSFGGVDLFEGTSPAPAQQSPQSLASNPLGGVDPGDPGVDISQIVGIGGHKWKSLM
jgi:hypothetical protein